jgi:CSLREA domain-containing protein
MNFELWSRTGGVRVNRRLWLVLALLLTLVSFAGWRLSHSGAHVRAQARLWLGTARQYGAASYKGSARSLGVMAAHPAALSMASSDLDGDGADDLAVGLSAPGGGLIAVHRGNLDAFAPQSDASFWAIARGEFPSPYLPEAELVEIPSRPDFLASGDFIGLGGSALAAAARGGQSIHVLARGASGKMELQQTMATPGPITGLISHNLKSGKYWQLAAGVRTPTGPQLVIYTGTYDGLSQTDSIPLAGDATAFASGNLDGDGVSDLLVVAGGQPAVLHGRSHRLDPVNVPYTVTAVALGNFVFDRDPLLQMALLSSDGGVHILARDGFDATPWTLAQMRDLRRRAILAQRSKAAVPPPSERSVAWKEIESHPGLGVASQAGRPPLMFRMRIASNGADDLALIGPSGISVLSHPDSSPTVGMVLNRSDLGADVAAALPARVNIDARPGVVYVPRGETEPYAMMPLPDPTFTVNTTSDFVSSNSNACLNAVAGQCSLREAVIEANATSGTDTIMVPNGTYTLTVARSGSPVYDAKTGTLDITDSVNIVGGGQSTTIIQGGTQGASSGNPNGVDKVFSFNQDITSFTNASVQVSNLTIQNGFNRGNESLTDGWGGAFDFDTGSNGTATLALSSVTITNNTLTEGEGAGFAIFNSYGGTGAVTATNCIISNNVNQPDASTAGGNGGGIAVEGSGKLTLITSQVTGNKANAAHGGLPSGGGIYFVGGETDLNDQFVNGSVTLEGVSVTSNSAAGEGGGIFSGGGMTIEASGSTLSTVSNNQSGGDGGGIMSDSGGQMSAEPLTISNVTITGNSTTGAGGTGDGLGGGIKINESGSFNALTMTYSRLAGNTCTVGGGGVSNPGTNLAVQNATVNVAHNWWGTNSPLTTIDSYSTSTVNYTPYLQLTIGANPTTVTDAGSDTSTVTASFLKDSGNNTVSATNLGVLVGVAISFGSPVDGTLSGADTTIQSTGTAAATFTGTHVGTGSASATVDAQTVTANIVVNSTTSTTATNASATFSESNQNVILTANLTATTGDTVNGGTTTFSVFNGGTQIGSSTTSGTVSGGTASATFTLPAGTGGGTYSIHASYSGTSTGTGDFLSSSDVSHTLTVNPASTTTVAANQTATFSTVSQNVTLAATVTSGAGTVNEGTVTFTLLNGATPVGTATTSSTVSNGSASVSYTVPAGTPVGTYTIKAVYNGDSNLSTSTDTSHTLTISAATTTAAANATATFSSTNQPVTLSATVTSAAGTVSTGTVTFSVFNGATQIGSSTAAANVTNGSASTTYTLPGGTNAATYTIQANYTGAGGFNSSSDNTHTLTVSAASTTTTAQNAAAGFSASPESVTLSATVTSTAGTVNAGTVTFTVLNGATPVGTATTSAALTNGNASVSYTLPAGTAVGTYTIQAVYNGATNFTTSSDNTHTLAVSSGTTTTASNTSATFNASSQSVTLAASVTSAGGTVNAGTVTFSVFNGAIQIGSSTAAANVVNGSASASYTLPGGINAGTYTIVASYTGAGGFNSSSDNTHTLTVNPASTTTTAANQTANFSSSTQNVTLSATVTSTGGTVNAGTVTFTVLNGATPVGTATTSAALTNGNASVSYTIPAGQVPATYTIKAVYNASTDFATSTDTTHTLTINGGTTTTAANASVTYSPSSQLVALAATVTSTVGTVTNGMVTFTILNGATPVGSPSSGNVSNGSASANYTLPGGTQAGTYTIQAVYSGGTLTGSSDSSHTLTVMKATPVISWSNPASIPFGSAITSTQLNATANVPGTFVYNPPAGTVLPVGNNQTLSAQFTPSDSTDYVGATASVQISVTPALAPAALVLTQTMARDPNTNNVIVTLTIANTGGSPATGVQVTSAAIGSTATLTSLPLAVPNVPGGGSSSVTLTFPASVGTSGARAVFTVNGSYSGGYFTGGGRVILP